MLEKLKENRNSIVNFLFYLALSIELFFMVLEKSEVPIPYISHVFRGTFLITLLAVAIMKHSRKELIWILVLFAFTFFCYRVTGKNDLLRFSMFVVAARDVNLEKTMKYWFYFSAIGFAVIALLSVTGVLGSIYIEADFGRGGVERRFDLGFGHPNTLCGCVYALLLMWIWIYGKKAAYWCYGLLLVASIILYKLTVSRTTILILVMTIVLAVAIKAFPKLGSSKIVFALSTIVSPILCVAFSVWAAVASKYRWILNEEGYYVGENQFMKKIDTLLNGRIQNLYFDTKTHEGAIQSWKLFSDGNSESFFDLGWVRVFYWYGIIPAILVVILVLVLCYKCYKRQDLWTMLLIFSMGIYTIVEATYVSRFIGRNFMLLFVAAFLLNSQTEDGECLKKQEKIYSS